MKKDNKGFMLIETLIVTTVVSGVLIFLFIEFSNLSKSYEESFKYNTTEGLYALSTFKNIFESNYEFLDYLDNNLDTLKQLDITYCTYITNIDYYNQCIKLIELENIDTLVITTNEVDIDSLVDYGESFTNFSSKISKTGNQKYRMIAKFNDDTFATVRFGD